MEWLSYDDYFSPMTTRNAETGVFYYGARYYDPKISVWLSVDPLASKFPTLTPYNFVENNPLRLLDPSGLGPVEAVGWGEFKVTSHTGSKQYDAKTRTTTISTIKMSVSTLMKENSNGEESWSASLLKTESSSVTLDENGEILNVSNTTSYSGWNADGDLNIGDAGGEKNSDFSQSSDFENWRLIAKKRALLKQGWFPQNILLNMQQEGKPRTIVKWDHFL